MSIEKNNTIILIKDFGPLKKGTVFQFSFNRDYYALDINAKSRDVNVLLSTRFVSSYWKEYFDRYTPKNEG